MKISMLYFIKSNYASSLNVENPSILYNGQKFTRLVSNIAIPIINAIIPKVPVINLPKNKSDRTMASVILILLSKEPIFFFI